MAAENVVPVDLRIELLLVLLEASESLIAVRNIKTAIQCTLQLEPMRDVFFFVPEEQI